MSLPLDSDGFLRRECPHCETEFKWFDGRADDCPDDFVDESLVTCPLCGRAATPDAWWTKDQLDLAQQSASAAFMLELRDGLSGMPKNDLIRFEMSGDEPDPPDPLTEPDDMVIVEPPCHYWERVKVPEEAVGPFYCTVCGGAYAA